MENVLTQVPGAGSLLQTGLFDHSTPVFLFSAIIYEEGTLLSPISSSSWGLSNCLNCYDEEGFKT